MRCTGCGLPLSPQRTHCPRCGKAAGKPEAQPQNQAETLHDAFSAFPEQGHTPAGVDALQEQSAAATQQHTNNEMAGQLFLSPETELSPDQSDHLRLPDPDETLQYSPEQQSSRQSSSQPAQSNASPGTFQPFPRPPYKPGQTNSRHTVQPGFAIAGLCVFSGGLILLLVYIISLSLPPLPTAKQPALVAAVNTPTPQSLPTRSQATPSPTLAPTVQTTPSLPGKAYIDNAQIGSSLNFNTAQLYQPTTNFTINQKIFVTFMLHPVNSGGAVCLLWYVNQKQFSQFTFAVGPIPEHAYSFALANSPGQGSVSIYWASSTACTDKALAQVVKFTVT
jgi:hypothetical protein